MYATTRPPLRLIRLWRFPRAALLVLATLGTTGLAACGDSGSIAPEDLSRAYTARFCAQVERCLPTSGFELLAGGDCFSTFEGRFRNTELGVLQERIDSGRIEYDAALVGACLDALTSDCNLFSGSSMPEVCQQAVDGTVATGDSCDFDIECDGAAYCDTDASCPGTCRPVRALGDRCQDDTECPDGTSCDGTCSTLVANGQACGGTTNQTCADLLSECEGSTPLTAGTCERDAVFTIREGDPCDPDAGEFCDVGLVCIAVRINSIEDIEFECGQPYESGAACRAAFPAVVPTTSIAASPRTASWGRAPRGPARASPASTRRRPASVPPGSSATPAGAARPCSTTAKHARSTNNAGASRATTALAPCRLASSQIAILLTI